MELVNKKGSYDMNNYNFRMKSDLKRLLDNRDLTIIEVADTLGLRRESVRQLYHDNVKRFPSDMLGKLCAFLNVGIDELLLVQRVDDKGNDL